MKVISIKAFRTIETTTELSFWIEKDGKKEFAYIEADYIDNKWEFTAFKFLTEVGKESEIHLTDREIKEIQSAIINSGQLENAKKLMIKRGKI